MNLLAFVLVSTLIILTPGPNVLVIVSTSLSHGRIRGLQTVAGTATAMSIQLGVAALGTAWLVNALTQGFLWLKWAGVVYLIYLGIRHLADAAFDREPTSATAMGSFGRGFWVSLTNPKTILFFSAFLPQFTDPSRAYLPQIVLLSAVFWVLAVLFDSCYALLSSWVAPALRGRNLRRFGSAASGLLYLTGGLALAAARRGE
jgi:threonine/homoserine/homoserine lactone efflux protein